jgi:hypothetical protein
MRRHLLLLLSIAAFASASYAWESCVDLQFASLDERACLALTMSGSVVEARGNFGTRTLGPYRHDLAALELDFRVQPTVEGCLSPGVPGVEVCLRVEDFAVRVEPPEARGFDGCFFVSTSLLKKVGVTRPLGCVNLTTSSPVPEEGEL